MLFYTKYSLVIVYVIVLHYIWAMTLLIDGNAAAVTATSGLYGRFDRLVPYFLLFASTTAWLSITRPRASLWPVLLIIPQQIVLMLSAYAAIAAMVAGRFADGVPRPHAFIIADQCPAVLIMVFHSIAVLRDAYRPDARL